MRRTLLDWQIRLAIIVNDYKFSFAGVGRTGRGLGSRMVENLGPIHGDFSLLTMSFREVKKLVTLNRKKGTVADFCSQKHFAVTLKKRRRGVLTSLTVLNMQRLPYHSQSISHHPNNNSSKQFYPTINLFFSRHKPYLLLEYMIIGFPSGRAFFPLRSSGIATPTSRIIRLKGKIESFYNRKSFSPPPVLTLLLFF